MMQLDRVLVKHQQQQGVLLDELLLQRDDKEQKRQEALMSAISQVVGNLVTAKLEDIVTTEIKNCIIPGMYLSLCIITFCLVHRFPTFSK
jgi:serine phosphatase RsbU (regulator of sigma subunit)